MDTKTGEILDSQSKAFQELFQRGRLVEMKEEPTPLQMRRTPPKVKGWERCPCGSGKLFKNCCKI